MSVKLEKTFMDEANQLNDSVNHIANKILEQQRLFQTTTIIKDIIKAYKGEITWDEYLKERNSLNYEIRTQNTNRVVNLKENGYAINYRIELPILDFETFSIAEQLGKLERNEQ